MKKHPLANCEACPLRGEKMARDTGPEGAKIVVVSRSPGKAEVGMGKVFSGPSGKVLNHLLSENDIKREDVRVTNVVLCKTEKPPKEAIEACKPRLLAEIKNAETVVACGAEAVQLFTGMGVHKARGYAHIEPGKRIIATFNPAAALHKPEIFPDLVKDFRLAFNPPSIPNLPTVRYTDDPREAREWIRSIRQSGIPHQVGCDIESFGLDYRAPLASFAMSGTGDRAFAIGVRTLNNRDFLHNYLKPLLESVQTRYVWHNGKFDIKNLRHKGINARCDEDTMLLSGVLDERPGTHSLEYVLMDVLGWPDYEPQSVKDFKKLQENKDINSVINLTPEELEALIPNASELYEYNAYDAAGTSQLFPILQERAIADDVHRPYQLLLRPFSDCFAQVELAGIHYDVEAALNLYEDDIMPRLWEWNEQAALLSGREGINLNSPKQLSEWYYDEHRVQLTELFRKDKPRSVDDTFRKEIIAGRFVSTNPRLVVEFTKIYDKWKQLETQRSRYIVGLIDKVDDEGKVHTSFKGLGTETGRLSGEAPNLQNITRTGRHEGLPNIRALFVSSPGRKLVQADYSQAELRTIASLSGDRNLTRIYATGQDLHNVTASRFFGPEFTKENRQTAKNCNFGGFYGQTPQTFLEKHGIPIEQSAPYIEWLWQEFADVAAWVEELKQRIKTDGFLQTPFGRKKRFHLLTRENANASYREGVNFMVQSTAHDFTLWSFINLHRQLDPENCQLAIEVHDSIVADTKEDYLDTGVQQIRQLMEIAPKETIEWELPFTVDVHTGHKWGELG
jgi:DNA polymerase-1